MRFSRITTIYKHASDGKLILDWNTNFIGHPTGISSDGNGLWIAGSVAGFETDPNLFYYSYSGELLYEYNPRELDIRSDNGPFSCVAWDGSALWYSPDSQFEIYRFHVPH